MRHESQPEGSPMTEEQKQIVAILEKAIQDLKAVDQECSEAHLTTGCLKTVKFVVATGIGFVELAEIMISFEKGQRGRSLDALYGLG